MRKYIILYIALCLHIAARGQTIADIDLSWLPQPTQAKALRYWIDDDIGSIQTTDILNGQHSVDVSSLINGLHTIHYQIIDSEDKVAAPYSSIFLKMESHLSESGEASTLRYWFDDKRNINICNANVGVQLLDASGLLDGLHTLHLQVVNVEGKVSYVASSLFLKTGSTPDAEGIKASKLIYWFDDEATIQYLDITDGVQMLDASELIEGLHTLHYQVLCNNGQMTPATSSLFLRMNFDVETSVAKSLRYWFDDEQTATEVEITEGVQMLDASQLIEGLHTVHYQIADSKGTLGAPASSMFLKMDYDTNTAIAKSIRYWFNDDASTVQVTDVANGSQTLDVSALPMGLHTLNYQLIDTGGNVGVPVTGIFFKSFDKVMANGHNSITKYQYWLNDNSATVKTVTLGETSNPYTLTALLPVESQPFRSSSFHFENKDGKPMMYAKNDFHVRFTDAAGYCIDDSRPFTDYSISREVNPVGELKATQTFAKVAENDVRWYTVNVEAGDYLVFKSSQATAIQLFSPSGKELYSASGSTSVINGGSNTWETGTHYVAVHDVTGSQSTMTLNYDHIDKYAMLEQNVTRVGNGGYSTITFLGNGFRDLSTVDLYNAQGDTIKCVDVGHESNIITTVTFDFTNVPLGQYNMLFHFTTEDRHFSGHITVEEAVDIELAKTVTFPSAFPHGLSTTYTVKITNMGNMTAYSVPIFTWIMNKRNKDGIYHIEYEGLDLPGIFDGVDMDSLSVSERAELQALSDEIGDEHYFKLFRVEDEDSPGDSVWVRSNYFFTNIAPYETKTIQLTLSANEGVWAYFTVPEDWPSYGSEQYANGIRRTRVRFKDSSLKDKYCCVKEKVECNASIMANVAGLINLLIDMLPNIPHAEIVKIAAHIVDCEFNILETAVSVIGDFTCGKDDETEKDFWEKVKSLRGTVSNTGVIWSCLEAFVPKARAAKWVVKWIRRGGNTTDLSDIMGLGKLRADCEKAYSTPKPGCPPCETCNGGGGSGGGSWDPNDIFGYLSKSGSHFINDLVSQVNYTIEFENDTTLAMAAAHEIVIKDTLDSRYFDLNTFTPTGIRIGSREVFLDEVDVVTNNDKTTFVKTIDMRPEINAIAQVEGEYNQKKGIAEWRFTSLDPMTMEPAEDVIQGILPVNYNGTSGIGEVMFEIGVKSGKNDGAEIKNRAGIVFDANTPILTPTWTNIVDAVAPTSIVDGLTLLNDSTVRVFADASDARSGVWKYEWYVQHGENAPWWKEGETFDDCFDFHFYEGFDYGFCVVVTDSAGNVEQKELARERIFKSYGDEFEEAVSLNPLSASPNGDSRIYDLSGRRQAVPKENQVNIIDKKKVLIR